MMEFLLALSLVVPGPSGGGIKVTTDRTVDSGAL